MVLPINLDFEAARRFCEMARQAHQARTSASGLQGRSGSGLVCFELRVESGRGPGRAGARTGDGAQKEETGAKGAT